MKVLVLTGTEPNVTDRRRTQLEGFLLAGAEAFVLLGQSYEKTYDQHNNLVATQIAAAAIKGMAYSAIPASMVGVAYFGVDPLTASVFTTLGFMKSSSLKKELVEAKWALEKAQSNHIPYSVSDLVQVSAALKTSLSSLGLSSVSHRVDLVKDALLKDGKMKYQSPRDLLESGLGLNSDLFQMLTPPDRHTWNRHEAVTDIKDTIKLLKSSQTRRPSSKPSL